MNPDDSVFVTGTSVRWSSVQTVEELWRSIREAKTCPEKVPEDRVAPLLSISDKLPKGYWIKDLDQFDPVFFALTPRESFSTEPSQRLSLTCSWEAVEDANLLVEDLQNYGVYSGCSSGDYMSLLAKFDQPENAFFWPIGNTLSGCPGRVAYFLGCKGPSVAVDSACASSLVAFGLCFSDMRSRSIDGGLVIGGNAISSNSLTSILFSNGLLAKDGRCKTFDTLADGFGRADAVAVLVVQSKPSLKCDAWLRVSTIVQGQDSNFKKSFTQTSAKGQSFVIQKALQCCGGSSKDLTLYFPHGNGSPFSDADEIIALQDSLSRSQSSLSLALSSSKTITGHSESASGALAVVILCLAMKHREIPRHINFSSINTSIGSKKMETENFSLCLEQTKWDSQYHVAAETSFGIGGSIACAMFKGCLPSVQLLSAQKSSWKTIEICVAHEASFTEAGKKYSEFLIENDVSMEHFVSSFSRRDRSFQKRVYMYSFSKKDLTAGFKAMEKYGAACRGFDGFSKASAISKKQGQIILCCGTFKRKSGVENFDAGLKVGKDLIEHGVVFSKSFFGESALAFAAAALLEHCPEKVARQQALSSGQRIKKVVKIFSTTAQASDCFRGCSWWSHYCVASSSRNESLDAAVSMGLRLVASDKTMLNQESYVHLLKYGMSFLLRQARKDDIYVMLGRWDDLWGKVRKDGCVGLHGLMGAGKWQGSSLPLLVSLKLFGKGIKIEENHIQYSFRLPLYPFLKRKFWPSSKQTTSNATVALELTEKCFACKKELIGENVVASGSQQFHSTCLQRKNSLKLSLKIQPVHSEDEIAAVFSSILGKPCGRESNFFLEGGTSSSALRLLEVLEEKMGAKIHVRDFLSNCTPQLLHSLMSEKMDEFRKESERSFLRKLCQSTFLHFVTTNSQERARVKQIDQVPVEILKLKQFHGFIKYLQSRGTAPLLDSWLEQIRSFGSSLLHNLSGKMIWAYESIIDGSGQPFVLVFPKQFSHKKSYPLWIKLHGYFGDHLSQSIELEPWERGFQVCPLGRTRGDGAFEGAGEVDVLDIVDYMTSNWKVDLSRIHLYGPSHGGSSSIRIAAKYPSLFCSSYSLAAAPNFFPSNQNIRNAYLLYGADDYLFTAFACKSFLHELDSLSKCSDFCEVKGFGHSVWQSGSADFGFEWVSKWSVPKRVSEVNFTSVGSSKRCFWIEIVEDDGDVCFPHVMAVCSTQTISILEEKNVSSIRLHLNDPSLTINSERALFIRWISGQCMKFDAPLPENILLMHSLSSKWSIATEEFVELHTPGGLSYLYQSRQKLVIVYGTSGSEEETNKLLQLARTASVFSTGKWSSNDQSVGGDKVPLYEILEGGIQVLADTQFQSMSRKDFHVILLGSAHQNKVVADIENLLPLSFSSSSLKIGNECIQTPASTIMGLRWKSPWSKGKEIFLIASSDASSYNIKSRFFSYLGGETADLIVMDHDAVVAARRFNSRWGWIGENSVPISRDLALGPSKLGKEFCFRHFYKSVETDAQFYINSIYGVQRQIFHPECNTTWNDLKILPFPHMIGFKKSLDSRFFWIQEWLSTPRTVVLLWLSPAECHRLFDAIKSFEEDLKLTVESFPSHTKPSKNVVIVAAVDFIFRVLTSMTPDLNFVKLEYKILTNE